jgi:AcrR family transcriptional regulator
VAPSEQSRPARADAQRNRQKLLEAALKVFAQSGIDASLEAIAQQAGVGIGTLYRHFPTREALALAAYQHDLEQVCEAADQLLLTLPPDAALRAWMARFSEYIVTKRGMSEVLKVVVTDPLQFYASLGVRGRMMTALETLLRRGTEAGLIRGDMDAEVVLLAMIGVWQSSPRRPDCSTCWWMDCGRET